MFSVQSTRNRIRRHAWMPEPRSPGDCCLQPHLAMKEPSWPAPPIAHRAGHTGGGIIDPVSAFDFRVTEFRSHSPGKVAFTIKASQHLPQST